MNEANQGNNSDFPENFPVKRKRGRPRKDQSKKRGENARIPPGFEGVDANLPLQVEPINVANDAMVGQVVSGVVDASFDAGYLLTVRVGNSDTILRGVVFKPGRYVPISSENDVAPHVQMIRRNEIHLPAGNQSQEQGYNPQARERNEQHGNFQGNDNAHPWNGSPPANHVPRVVPRAANVAVSKGKQVQTVVTPTVAHPVGGRSTLVPVVLPPASQSTDEAPPVNLVPPPDIQAANPAASKGKQVLVAALQGPHSSNGSTSNNQISTVAKVMKNEDTFCQTPTEVVCDAECRSMRMPNMPFETLLGEVVKRIQVPSQSEESQIQDTQESGLNLEEGHNMNRALIIKPLQAVQPNHHDHTASAPQHLDNMTDRMTELLQALPDYVRESQVPGVQDARTSSARHFDEPRNQEEATGDSLQ